ncbi:MAG: glycosyltransferase family 1 protein [Bacillota bacterium]|nr:glycosyltransferase family 1 protein [Bacillota bacterium]
MKEKIKVLHVVGRMDRGGTEALLMSLLRTLDTDSFQYDFVEQTQDVCDYDEEIASLGATIYRCPHISIKNLQAYRKWWRTFFLEHPEYTIVHGHSRGSAPIYLDEAKKAGRITIAHCHNNSHGKGLKGLIRYIWQIPLRKMADYNFACSYDSGISQFGKHSPFEVIKNGIQSEKFLWNEKTRKRIRDEFSLENKFVVGNVARFEEQKNHLFLIEVFYEILKIQENAVLMLVGQGTREQEIRDLAKKLGILDRIVFTGVRSDVYDLMQAMDVFVLPSLFEGLGIVNIEAQAASLPVFTSAQVVPKEIEITDLVEFISLKESPETWAKHIVNSPKLLWPRKNRHQEIIDHGFDIRATKEKLENFYEEVRRGK